MIGVWLAVFLYITDLIVYHAPYYIRNSLYSSSSIHVIALQIQEIGDLQAAVKMKADFRKMELQMKQKERQYQDATTRKLQLQQQVIII